QSVLLIANSPSFVRPEQRRENAVSIPSQECICSHQLSRKKLGIHTSQHCCVVRTSGTLRYCVTGRRGSLIAMESSLRSFKGHSTRASGSCTSMPCFGIASCL